MKNVKTCFGLLAAILFINTVNAQSVKSFLIANSPIAKAVLVHPSDSGDGPSWKTILVYTKKTNAYLVFSKEVFNGMTPTFSEKTIVFVGSEAKITRLRSKGMAGEIDKQFSPAKTIFKIPIEGQKCYWNDPTAKELTKRISELTSVVIGTREVPAIKLTKQGYYANGKPVAWAKSVEYYVQGIGLYKTCYKNGKTMSILESAFSDSEEEVAIAELKIGKFIGGIETEKEELDTLSVKSLVPVSKIVLLTINGWKFKSMPAVEMVDGNGGMVSFQFEINDEGDVESVRRISGNVSGPQQDLCTDALLNSKFLRTSASASATTGHYTFKFEVR